MLLSSSLGFRIIAIIVGLMATDLLAEGSVKQSESADRVAIVNGTPINRGEFEGNVLITQRNLLEFGKPLTCKQVASIQTEVLESMVRVELLYQESLKLGIKPDEIVVEQELKAIKQQFPNEADYINDLKRRNISEEILHSRLEKNSSVQQYIARDFATKSEVKDSDMVAYYESHIDLFKQPLQVRVSHILIQSDPKWDAARKLEARQKAEQIMKDLKKGQNFATLAREQSDGPTRTNGGDLGYIRMGQLEKQLESVVFSLQSGETSEVVETDYGFHVFRVVDRKTETILAYDSVKDRIKQYLMQEKAKQAADQHAKTLREKTVVEILLKEDTVSVKQP